MIMSNASKIVSAMFEKNLPPTQAAKAVGVTFDTLIRAISGDVRIRFDTAAKFRRAFGDEAVRVVKGEERKMGFNLNERGYNAAKTTAVGENLIGESSGIGVSSDQSAPMSDDAGEKISPTTADDEKNFIDCAGDSSTSETSRQQRIAAAEQFFNLVYGNVSEPKFGYLWSKCGDVKKTYSVDVSRSENRAQMAKKAIELNDSGADVYFGVNLVDSALAPHERARNDIVTVQTAIVVDIDICSGAHKSDNLAADFDEAKSFLPFTPSILVNSGYGLHAYYLFDEPIQITDDNRDEIKRRNNRLLDVVRQRANGKKIDSVGDLSRVLRTIGTFNYKLGKDDSPLCNVVETNDVRFSPADIDEKLTALTIDINNAARLQSEWKYSNSQTDGSSFGISDSISLVTNRQERAGNMNDLLTTREAADILGVTPETMRQWRSRKLFGCYFFTADEIKGNTWYYRRERVEQLKSVYQFGILQNMYKLAKRNPEPIPPVDFQNGVTSRKLGNSENGFQNGVTSWGQDNFGEELSFRHREFFTLDEVADYFGVSKMAVSKWHESGILKEDMLGHNGDLYFGIDNVIDFVPPKQSARDKKLSDTADQPTDRERAQRMLDFIPPADLSYDDWLAVGMALKNVGCDCSDWEQWSRADERFKFGECESKWNGFNGSGVTIATLHRIAQSYGYSEKDFQREWYQQHPESQRVGACVGNEAATIDDLQSALRKVEAEIAAFDDERAAALERIRQLSTFDSDSVFADEILTAAAHAFLADKQLLSNLKRDIKGYSKQHTDQSVNLTDWYSAVRGRAAEIVARISSLRAQRAQIVAKITSNEFTQRDNSLGGIRFPDGYAVDADGIFKIVGDFAQQVCRRPVIVRAKVFNVDAHVLKFRLSYQSDAGKWIGISPSPASTVFNARRLVELADSGLPVTSTNANLVVDYLDAFNAENGKNLPLSYEVGRCGWHEFDAKTYFVEPRRDVTIERDGKKIAVVVDDASRFAKSLHTRGTLEQWKRAYDLAKSSPVARFMVAAATAPPLLKILGERNFLLYIYAPTRAGKTTALYLGASAVGDEKIIRSFDATKNGLIAAAADVNDYPFLIDERQSADRWLQESKTLIIYALANGVGRTRLNKDSTLKKVHDWRTIAIMTGEVQWLDDRQTAGADTRLLSVHAPETILSADDCQNIRNIVSRNYGHAFPRVVEKIVSYGEDFLRGQYEQRLTKIVAESHSELLNEHGRYLALVTLADAILAVAIGAADFDVALAEAAANADQIAKLLPTTNELSPTKRYRDFVTGFVSENQNRFIQKIPNGASTTDVSKMSAIYGEITESRVYLTVRALREACDKAGMDYRHVADTLSRAGFFEPSIVTVGGKNTMSATVNKKLANASTRCYRFWNCF